MTEMIEAIAVRKGDVVQMPLGSEVVVHRVEKYDMGTEAAAIVLVYRSGHEWSFENRASAAKGPEMHGRRVLKSLAPFKPGDLVPLVRLRD
jgi:hypothetical protein